MTAAKDALLRLSDKWGDIDRILSKYEKVTKGTTNSRRRWNRHQNAFEAALDFYEKDLEAAFSAAVVAPKRKVSKGIP